MLRLQFIPAYGTPFSPSADAGDAFVVLSAVISEQRVGRKVEPIFRAVIKNPGVAGWMPSALRYADLWEQRAYDPIHDTPADPTPVHLARGRLVPRATRDAGPRGPSTESLPTDCGTSSGPPARTRRTTSRSTPRAA